MVGSGETFSMAVVVVVQIDGEWYTYFGAQKRRSHQDCVLGESGSTVAAVRRLRQWRQRNTATSAIACRRRSSVGSTKHGGGKQCNGGSAVAAAWRLRRWRQHDTATSAIACRRSGSVGSTKRGGGKQRDGGSAVAAARRLWRWWQRDTATSAIACRWRGSVGSAKRGGREL